MNKWAIIYALLIIGISILIACILWLIKPPIQKERMFNYFNIENYLQTLSTTQARYIRIIPSAAWVAPYRWVGSRPPNVPDGLMTISQIQVLDMNGNNIALTAAVTATSTAVGSAPVSVIIDGTTNIRNGDANVWTSGAVSTDNNPQYVEIDLGSIQQISQVVYIGRGDSPDVAARANGMYVKLYTQTTPSLSLPITKTFITNDPEQVITFLNAINLTPYPTGNSISIMNPSIIPINSPQPEVFMLTATDTGMMTKPQAQVQCSQLGGTLATLGQLTSAYNNGAEWCFPGWVQDKDNAYFPIQTASATCGTSIGTSISTLPTTIVNLLKAGTSTLMITAGYLNNTDTSQTAIIDGTRKMSTAITNATCFGIKPPQSINAAIKPFNANSWSQYSSTNTALAYFGDVLPIQVPDVLRLYSLVGDPSDQNTPPAWIAARADLLGNSLYGILKTTAPFNFLYDTGSTVATITNTYANIKIFGTATAAAVADMNASINLCKRIFIGSSTDIDKFINISYNNLKPYIRSEPGYTNFCRLEITNTLNSATNTYELAYSISNALHNTIKCNTELTTDMLGLLPSSSRSYIIQWIYDRTQRIISFKNGGDVRAKQAILGGMLQPNVSPPAPDSMHTINDIKEAQYNINIAQEALDTAVNATRFLIPTTGGSPILIDITSTTTLDSIAQSFYEAMGGNYLISNIYDVYTVGGAILDVRFDLTKHADISALQSQIAKIKAIYYKIRASNVTQDILDSAKQNYESSLADLQMQETANTLPDIIGVVGRFFYTYANGSVTITGFTLDARAVTSFISELNGGIQVSTGGDGGTMNYQPNTIFTKNMSEPLQCTDPITIRRIIDDYLDAANTDLAKTLFDAIPSVDVTLGSIRVSSVTGAAQVGPLQCALTWKETQYSDTTNLPIKPEVTNITRSALFSYTGNTVDWYASDIVMDIKGFSLFLNNNVPQCAFIPSIYQTSVAPRLDRSIDSDITYDFLVNVFKNGTGNPCPKDIPNYVFSISDYVSAIVHRDLNTTYNNSGKGPLDVVGATAYYVNTGIYRNNEIVRAMQAIPTLTQPVNIIKNMPWNNTLDSTIDVCPITSCEDLKVLYTLVDQYNNDPTQPGTILRVTRAYTANPYQCDMEYDINYDIMVTDTNLKTVRKGSFTFDSDGNQISSGITIPTGVIQAETRAFSTHLDVANCSYVLDSAGIPGSGTSIQSNTPALYMPMEYATQFQQTTSARLAASMTNIAADISGATISAVSILGTYREQTYAAVGDIASLGSCQAKCSDTEVLNSMLAYYKTTNLHRKQINTIQRVGTLNSTTCDITFQEDTLVSNAGSATYSVSTSQTAGLRFTMAPQSNCTFTVASMTPILPSPPWSVVRDMAQPISTASTYKAGTVNYVNPAREAFVNYGASVQVAESTYPLNERAFGLDMARNKSGPSLDARFQTPLKQTINPETAPSQSGPMDLNESSPVVKKTYKYLRFRPMLTRNPENPSVDIGKLRFFLDTNEIDIQAAKVTNPMGSWIGGIDDITGPGYRRGWSDVYKKALMFAFPYPILVNGFSWTTASPDRGLGGDPIQWKLEGSTNGVYWSTLHQLRHSFPITKSRFQDLPIFRFK